jgi:hypothetical protein
MKKEILGSNKFRDQDLDMIENIPRFTFLQLLRDQWQMLIDKLNGNYSVPPSKSRIEHLYSIVKCIRKLIRKIEITAQLIRKEEWIYTKTYFIQIGKFSQIAHTVNPKKRSGPIANTFCPTKPGQPIKRAKNAIF